MITTFDLTRRTNPSAAFAEMFRTVRSAFRDGGELAEAARLFKGGTFIRPEDAARIAALEKKGTKASAFKVGSLPPLVGPGIALMYDAALETLRSSDRIIKPDCWRPRNASVLIEMVHSLVPITGSASATALEMASKNAAFAGHLRDRGVELGGVINFDDPPGPDPNCEYCRIIIQHMQDQPPESYCGTKEECETIGAIFLALLIIWGLGELGDWLFG